jgi:uncharacterized alkaline shock family protein YloU
MDMVEQQGSVTLSPNALISIIGRAIRDIDGVARMGTVPPSRVPTLLIGSHTRDGILVRVNDTVSVDVYVVARNGANLLQLGEQVQETIGSALQHMAGMDVRDVNVYVQDVEAVRG